MEHWFDVIVGILVAILGWFGVTLYQRQKETEEKQHAMQLNCVTRDHLQQELTQMRADRRAMHHENKVDMTDLKESLDKLSDTVHLIALKVAALPSGRRSRT